MKQISLFPPYSIESIHPGFSIDCVIFSYSSKKIKVLLNKFDFSKYWQLPGGFMLNTESAEQAAYRILNKRTGMENIYLRQFHLFSNPERTKIEQNTSYIEGKKKQSKADSTDAEQWFLRRFISLGFYSFIKHESIKLKSTPDDTAKWFDIRHLPELYSDHLDIINKAIENIQSILTIVPVAQELLPAKFTMGEFRKIYEIILDKKFDRRNFLKKALSSGILIQLDEVKTQSSYNPPILYSFSNEKQDMNDFHSFFK